ncbi:hypothetical protein AYI70_g397 [Smittium culicis]|uniref:Uncharacterized protein n=1 Tax=Smittium culicis TaxID=133412 RepID=A0A1R1YGV5_9FUNG|nr:hypothetical protein AYI70_g5553 [Smittium culicis]OMJ26148.1 hypothetical protein AYI70_g397 [Smittium culicis]
MTELEIALKIIDQILIGSFLKPVITHQSIPNLIPVIFGHCGCFLLHTTAILRPEISSLLFIHGNSAKNRLLKEAHSQ